MDTNKIKSDFLAARVKTTITVMNATGWKQGFINEEYVGVDAVFLYVFDRPSQWIWACSIPKESFDAVLVESKKFKMDDIVACCEALIQKSAGKDDGAKNNLALALSGYIGMTKVYGLTNNGQTTRHFAVIRYGDLIRPFAMNGPARHLVDAASVLQTMREIVRMDSANHPEWFSN